MTKGHLQKIQYPSKADETTMLSLPMIEDPSTVTVAAVCIIFVIIVPLLWNSFNGQKRKALIASAHNAQLPPRVVSYVPFLGSALELDKLGFGGMAKKYSKQFDDSPIVTVNIAGKTMHVIANPAALPSLFRYGGQQMSMVPVVRELSQNFFCMSERGLSIFNLGETRRMLINDLLHKHMIKSNGIVGVIKLAQQNAKKYIENITSSTKEDGGSAISSTIQKFDLYSLISRIVFKASLETLVSKAVATEKFISTYEKFENGMKLAFAGMPIKYFARDAYKALQEIIEMLCQDDFPISDHLAERRKILSSMGMTREDMAKDDLLWVWASMTNLVPSQFWNFYHIFSNPDVMEAIREEVDSVISKRKPEDGPFDGAFTMEELDSMVRVESAYKEVLRLSFYGSVLRVALQDMTFDLKPVGSKLPTKYFLEKGSSVVFYLRTLHYDPDIFESPDEYRWNRFLPDPVTGQAPTFQTASGESINDPFRSFGGGSHYCPGRKYAMNFSKSLVANMVYKYDMKILGSTEFDMERDQLGVLHPKDAVEIELSERNMK